MPDTTNRRPTPEQLALENIARLIAGQPHWFTIREAYACQDDYDGPGQAATTLLDQITSIVEDFHPDIVTTSRTDFVVNGSVVGRNARAYVATHETPHRRTPDDIAHTFHSARVDVFRARLAEHGYVIVHPNDVPQMMGADSRERQEGWNACRASIFRSPPNWDHLT